MDISDNDSFVLDSNKVINKLIKELFEYGINIKYPRVKSVRFRNCGIGTSIVLDSDGKIYPCSKFSTYFCNKNISSKELIERFNKLNKDTNVDNMLKCKKCKLKFICSGGCRIDNLNHCNNMNEPICNDKYKKRIYEKLVNDELS